MSRTVTSTGQSGIEFRLAAQFAGEISQARDDLLNLSNLHQDFVRECFAAIDAKKLRAGVPLAGEYFPHLVARSLQLDDQDRRILAAATLAMYGYIYLVDYELDRNGFLNGRASIAASALLAWSIATIGRYTAGTRYADVFLSNINQAMAGQYEDMQKRASAAADRERSDIDKNRPSLAIIAGFCAAAHETDDRLIRAAEALLGPIQIFDDLHDVKEDHDENNITAFVRIVRDCASPAASLSENDMYRMIVRDPRINTLLARCADTIERTLLILDPRRDAMMIEYLCDTRDRTGALVHALGIYQRNPTAPAEAEVFHRIGEMRASQDW
jgi:hypothetical protein